MGDRFSIVLGLESMWNVSGKPDLSARGGIGNLRGDHSVRLQPPRVSALGRLRGRVFDGQRAMASDQQDDDVTEKNMLVQSRIGS